MPRLASVKGRTRVMNIDKEAFDSSTLPEEQHDDIMRNAVTFKPLPSHVAKILLDKNPCEENHLAFQSIARRSELFGEVLVLTK